MSSRYIIGIDLGTTNCAVAYVDTTHPALPVQSFSIPQLVEEGWVQPREALPSFCLLPERLVGEYAREFGARVPTRLVSSAKSWLCNGAASRKEKILPREAASEEERMSPVEASAAYLRHIREQWNRTIGKSDPDCEFEQQEVILTVPASFDEVARQLTVDAAKLAGFRQMTLLEEPQAAFYAWIGKKREHPFHKEHQILVVDVGGGTTDLSLIEVAEVEPHLKFQRMAVGEHLLLGGDNLDRAIAYQLEQQLGDLDQEQRLSLLYEARRVKEATDPEISVTLQGKGRSVVGGSRSLQVNAAEMQQQLLEGFFRWEPFEQAAAIKRSGIRQVGLPYEEEPSILKHIAAFLKRAGAKRPDWVLFNGGTMTPPSFRQAVLEGIGKWFDEEAPDELPSDSLDLAVSRGAASYGKVRRGHGIRIGGGSPRAYYLGIQKDEKEEALCLLPRGSEEGCEHTSTHLFTLQANRLVQFPLYTSSTRLHDQSGELVQVDEEQLQQLPPLQTLLRFGKKENHRELKVKLHTKLTEIGTLELWLESEETEHRWNLEFQLRRAEGQEDSLLTQSKSRQDETFDISHLAPALALLDQTFKEADLKPRDLPKKLEEALDQEKWEWSPSVLRGLADHLLTLAEGRKKSDAHGQRWWNLLGFTLRPGLGHPLDDHRLKRLWKVILEEQRSTPSPDLQIQEWICFRRVAAGFNKGQQLQLATPLFQLLLSKKGRELQPKKNLSQYAVQELIRTLGAFELLPHTQKERLGAALLTRLQEGGHSKAEPWALGRIASRHLLGGTIADVLPATTCSPWAEGILAIGKLDDALRFPLQQMGRPTDQRELDLPVGLRERIAGYGIDLSAVSQEQRNEIVGDALPLGLVLQ